MIDSGSTKSFIDITALNRTKHLPIYLNKFNYLMKDGCTTFQVIGIIKIFIELHHITTTIVVRVVNSLCADCILGMVFINKYKCNFNNKKKQVQVYTSTDQVPLPMEEPVDKIKIVCKLEHATYLNPYQERQIKIVLQVSSGQMLFSPAYHLIQQQDLIIRDSSISIRNHVAWISVHNSTPNRCYLNQNAIVGIASPLLSNMLISPIIDLHSKETTV
ncbi:unnamed protein product, partial [Rotaria sp. Silwood2]